jgi:hypothetical protein
MALHDGGRIDFLDIQGVNAKTFILDVDLS